MVLVEECLTIQINERMCNSKVYSKLPGGLLGKIKFVNIKNMLLCLFVCLFLASKVRIEERERRDEDSDRIDEDRERRYRERKVMLAGPSPQSAWEH